MILFGACLDKVRHKCTNCSRCYITESVTIELLQLLARYSVLQSEDKKSFCLTLISWIGIHVLKKFVKIDGIVVERLISNRDINTL